MNITRAGQLRRLLEEAAWPIFKNEGYGPGHSEHARTVALLILAEAAVELAECMVNGALAVVSYDPNAE